MINNKSCKLQLKEQESEDSVLTSDQQLDRLLRPGSTYLNLNPFEVGSLISDLCTFNFDPFMVLWVAKGLIYSAECMHRSQDYSTIDRSQNYGIIAQVLQISPDTDLEQAKKKYKKLSLLIHPDKNPDDRERADKAFDSEWIWGLSAS